MILENCQTMGGRGGGGKIKILGGAWLLFPDKKCIFDFDYKMFDYKIKIVVYKNYYLLFRANNCLCE